MAAVAMGLYIDGDEFDKAFDEAVTMHATPGELRFMLVTMYKQGGDPEKMINNHRGVLISDITVGAVEERVAEDDASHRGDI